MKNKSITNLGRTALIIFRCSSSLSSSSLPARKNGSGRPLLHD
jgi:hypothetical protein